MHPVEHLLYYSVTLLPLLFVMHPLHFLYCKFHADIAPIGCCCCCCCRRRRRRIASIQSLVFRRPRRLLRTWGEQRVNPPLLPSTPCSRARDHWDRYHYLHHAKYECNYGVPFPIDFDSIFGTWRTFADYNLPDPNRTSAPPTCEPNGNWQSVRPRLRSPTGKREK